MATTKAVMYPSNDESLNTVKTPLNPDPPSSYQDAENGWKPSDDYVGFMNDQIRRGFIRKVYAILAVQLVVTFGIVLLFSLSSTVKFYVQTHPWMLYTSMIGTIVVIIALSCCGNARRSFPMNYIMLGIFTLFEAYLLGVVGSVYQTSVVVTALAMTIVLSLSLTAFACQTRIDFTLYSGSLFCVLIVFVMMGFTFPIWCWGFGGCRALNIVYSALGVLIFGIFLVYDTQLIVGGRHKKFQMSPDEYVFAALNLYLDIVLLFMYILSLLGGGGRN